MDIGILLGFIVALFSLIIGFLIEGGTLLSLMQLSAAMIVFGGTIGAVIISFPINIIKRLPSIIKVSFSNKESDVMSKIQYLKEISSITRKEGLLSLEREINKNKMDSFMQKGFQLVVDGVEGTIVKSILETRLEQIIKRHEDGISMLQSAGGYTPTMGIIGTVMGLVQVVGNLSDPTSLGPKIASAFMATLYGIASANILWLPIANKLRVLNEKEINEKEMIIEAILLIQEGINPNTLETKLEGFLDKKY